jgi:hypothetical protein
VADTARSNFAGASLAGITDDLGNALVSPDTFGGSAFVLGPSVYRLIVAGVSNGDIASPPADATALLSNDNPLPFFTWDNTGGTGITAQVVANGTASSGNALRITIGTAVTSGTATLTRIEPITGTGDRGFAFIPQMTAIGTLSGGTAALADLYFSWLAPDQSTVVGTAPAVQTLNFESFYSQNAVTLSAGDDAFGAAGIYNCAPVGSKFLQMTARFRVTAAGTGIIARTLDVTDFAIAVGEPVVYLAEQVDANEYGAGSVSQSEGSITIQSGGGTAVGSVSSVVTVGNGNVVDGDPTYGYINLDAGLTGVVGVTGNVDVTGDVTAVNVYATAAVWSPYLVNEETTSSNLNLRASSGLVTVQDSNVANGTNPRITFYNKSGTPFATVKSGAANVVQILNGASATDYAQLWAERIYPMNGTTASRYFFDDGTRLASSGGFDANGTIYASGAMVSDAISTTTQTASAAIWVLSSGTTYSLRRNSSSLRYKTNVENADSNVLDAARRVKPRHYESTIAEEAGATRLGFIAEEVHDAGLTHAVGYDEEGRPESLDAAALIAALWHRVDDLEARLAALEGKE